jgi:ubiquinone/menaquinone biosynthesis C-methylase UbiE
MKEMSGLKPRQNIFNEAANLYDEVRPGYPEEIIDAIVALATLPPGGNILEIGCGTGQLTVPFAARGYTILALEPGDALAALAVQKCQPYPRVNIVQTSFEAWPVQRQAFDLVLSAQAFHWITPDYGCAKGASALKSGGALALVWHLDMSQHTAFWQATQPIYDAYFPKTPTDGTNMSLGEKANRYKEALCRSSAFANLREIRHAWEKTYPGADYLKLLNTSSNHRALPEPDKTHFFQAITEVIHRVGGVVHRKYETLLLLARKP